MPGGLQKKPKKGKGEMPAAKSPAKSPLPGKKKKRSVPKMSGY